jgi:hypothetical protein
MLTEESVKDGKIQFPVANPVVKKYLELEIYKIGGVTDTSFNHEILVISLYDLLRLLNAAGDAEAAVKKQLKLKLGKKDADQQEVQNLLSSPPAELFKKIGTSAKKAGAIAVQLLPPVLELITVVLSQRG